MKQNQRKERKEQNGKEMDVNERKRTETTERNQRDGKERKGTQETKTITTRLYHYKAKSKSKGAAKKPATITASSKYTPEIVYLMEQVRIYIFA
jgi:hypothetical protein